MRRGRAERNRAEGNDGFRLPTFLLHLHSLSRSKDTSSVLPYGNLPSPPKGRFGRSAAPHRAFARAPLRLFLAAPCPVPTTDHEPLFTVRYFIARAAFEC